MRAERLRCLTAIVDCDYSVSRAAHTLGMPQPAVSRHVAGAERELGVDIFVRRNNRLRGLTRPGVEILSVARRILRDTANLSRIARDFAARDSGAMVVATTHTQARYALPEVIRRLSTAYPQVECMLRQGSPGDVIELLRSGEADICIGSETSNDPALVFFPCYRMERVILVPRDHALLRVKRPTLEDLAKHPIITYDAPFLGRSRVVAAFRDAGFDPRIALSAMDTDVIKAYVEQGMGIAIIAEMAYDAARDRRLRKIPAKHLFAANTIHIGVRRDDYLPEYVLRFIELFSPKLKRDVVRSAVTEA